jgi:hypothetical protein
VFSTDVAGGGQITAGPYRIVGDVYVQRPVKSAAAEVLRRLAAQSEMSALKFLKDWEVVENAVGPRWFGPLTRNDREHVIHCQIQEDLLVNAK